MPLLKKKGDCSFKHSWCMPDHLLTWNRSSKLCYFLKTGISAREGTHGSLTIIFFVKCTKEMQYFQHYPSKCLFYWWFCKVCGHNVNIFIFIWLNVLWMKVNCWFKCICFFTTAAILYWAWICAEAVYFGLNLVNTLNLVSCYIHTAELSVVTYVTSKIVLVLQSFAFAHLHLGI